MDVSILDPWSPTPAPAGFLACCPYYGTRAVTVEHAVEHHPPQDRFELLIALEGSGRIDGEPFQAGQTWHVPEGSRPFSIEPVGTARFLTTSVP
jgi:hypothetical protein